MAGQPASSDRFSRVMRVSRSCARSAARARPTSARVLRDRRRLADEIALHHVAALVGEEAELFLGFDALGDDRHVEAVAEADHRADDRRRLRVAAEIHDEGAVDLDLVERERLQIGQRRIAAAEIVHRDAHAERLQPAQQREAALEILDQHAFGDFQLQPARGRARFPAGSNAPGRRGRRA